MFELLACRHFHKTRHLQYSTKVLKNVKTRPSNIIYLSIPKIRFWTTAYYRRRTGEAIAMLGESRCIRHLLGFKIIRTLHYGIRTVWSGFEGEKNPERVHGRYITDTYKRAHVHRSLKRFKGFERIENVNKIGTYTCTRGSYTRTRLLLRHNDNNNNNIYEHKLPVTRTSCCT